MSGCTDINTPSWQNCERRATLWMNPTVSIQIELEVNSWKPFQRRHEFYSTWIRALRSDSLANPLQRQFLNVSWEISFPFVSWETFIACLFWMWVNVYFLPFFHDIYGNSNQIIFLRTLHFIFIHTITSVARPAKLFKSSY